MWILKFALKFLLNIFFFWITILNSIFSFIKSCDWLLFLEKLLIFLNIDLAKLFQSYWLGILF